MTLRQTLDIYDLLDDPQVTGLRVMGSPVDMLTKNEHEVSPKRDAILSIDTTKGNRVFNHHGIADFCCQKEQGITDFSEVAPGRQPFHAL